MRFGCWTATSRLPRSRGCSMKGYFYCACLCTPLITSRIFGTIFSLAGVCLFLCLTDIPATSFPAGSLIFLAPGGREDEGPWKRGWNNSRPFIQLSTTSREYFLRWVLFLISYSVNHYFKLVWCSYLTGFSGVLTFCIYLPYMQFKISRFSAGSVTVNLFLYVAL